ncbi:hypothetical protein [Dactylococcopsis salina]|uniref:hypothetical protein n=1 Tax=Dactylococcopsis salina TaxID=292566 RepID=UPI0012E9FDDD|nr:hypothetical protein [Dactylococcopsis salina]
MNYTDQYDHPWKEAIGLYFPSFGIFLQDLEVAFEQEIEQFEEETRMSYMTSWERRGREKGIQEGIQEILESRFGEVENSLMNSVREINEISRLKTLLRQATTVNSLQEFQSLLGAY